MTDHERIEFWRGEAEKLRRDRDRLRNVLVKTAEDFSIAQFGEGYGFNLPFIVIDIRAALAEQP